MAFCSNCGAAVEGRFCAQCGNPVSGEAAAGTGAPGATPIAPPAAAAALSDNTAGALCYALLLITGVLFLVLEPYSRNRSIRFHAFQSIYYNVAWFVIWFACSMVLGVLHLALLLPLIWLCFVGLWIYLIITTAQGKTVVLPGIGPLAQKQS